MVGNRGDYPSAKPMFCKVLFLPQALRAGGALPLSHGCLAEGQPHSAVFGFALP
jgi:hypothetical protein